MSEVAVFFAVILTEIALLLRAVGRFGYSPVPTMALIYVVVSQSIFCLVHFDVVEYPFLLTFFAGGTRTFFSETVLLYFCIFTVVLVPYADVLLTRNPIVPRGSAREVRVGRIAAINMISLLGLTVFTGSAIGLMNWDVAWANSVYLSMTTPAAALVDDRFGFVLSLFPIIGMWAAVVCGLNIAKKQLLVATVFGLFAAAYSIHGLASHQRTAILEPVALAITVMLVGTKRHRLVLTAAFSYAAFALISALVGRGMGRHGIATILDVFDYSDRRSASEFITLMITNLCEGIFVVAEGFPRVGDFPLQYKILSFLPTPSFLDGYDKVREVYQIRLTRYVPMSGYSEAYFFGPEFSFSLLLLLILTIVLHRVASTKSKVSATVGGFLILLSIVTLSAYPLRNGLKALWVANAINLTVLLLANGRPFFGSFQTSTRTGGAKG
ncbi:hypothetical protein AOQ72_08600 [Bradyrhizobium yuanmingense]|uniref:Oligosaccharide repeat unit polymerase n=1 Tax=Bradyrhizobium yuanmingense TaxID=108015 RepID=A0A0R3CV73_9BRAD|nr:hypothetical protein [Bradyrhizobium yuanmingense]KRQ01515.1 hypothetical protein AOQ72_08600 [Bradyrhizobium yuanmingense]